MFSSLTEATVADIVSIDDVSLAFQTQAWKDCSRKGAIEQNGLLWYKPQVFS